MDNKRKGYLFYVEGVCLYSLCDAIMKYFMLLYGVHQVTVVRTIFRFIPFLLFAFYKQINPLKTKRVKENICRSLLASCGTYLFMYAYSCCAMTDVFVVGLTTSIFVIPFSVLILNEKFYMQNAIAVLLGFLGICLSFRLKVDGIFQFGIIFAVAGAIISALNQVIIKKLSYTESELTIIFYHHLVLLIISPLLLVFTESKMFPDISLEHLSVLFIGGIIGALAQYLITHAFKLATSSGLASAGYVMLIPNTLFDLFLYDKVPDMYIIGGLILISIGTLRAFSIQSKT